MSANRVNQRIKEHLAADRRDNRTEDKPEVAVYLTNTGHFLNFENSI